MSNLDVEAKQAQYDNEVMLAGLQSRDPHMRKEANDTLDDFIRMRMREGGLARKIIPPEKKGPKDIDRQANEEKPTFVIDLEAESPAAVGIGFGDKPDQYYIQGDRFLMVADRIVTNRFWKDTAEMMSWKMDIQTVVSDNSIKDMMAEEDTKLIHAVDRYLGAINSIVYSSGIAQYRTINGNISRNSFIESLKVLPSTPSKFSPSKLVMNHITILDFLKWGRIEAGGDMSERLLKNGITELNSELIGIPLISTIKSDLIPTNEIYYFADPKAFGRFYILDDVTMFTKAETYIIEFLAYSLISIGLANINAVSKVRFT
jgi:hypothetical protein